MNFLSAIKHLAIDYGARRRVWPITKILSLGNGTNSCELYWCEIKGQTRNDPVQLLGPDPTWDLTAEDITATDWEAI